MELFDLSSSFIKVRDEFKKIQNEISDAVQSWGEVEFLQDLWTYEKGDGGGDTRVWEQAHLLEKGGVNFSAICGAQLPAVALKSGLDQSNGFCATGVSLVFHPHNPFVPTIHMNIRYFESGSSWWFGGGMDLTPYYTERSDIVDFHKVLKSICDKNGEDYFFHKKSCDEYFYLPHRQETRGVGGLFCENLRGDFEQRFQFICDLGRSLIVAYQPFIAKYSQKVYTTQEREFQLWRRSRYVEFNLLFDRGTHFGIQSEGRTESILMSMPAQAIWKYNYKPESGTRDAELWEYLHAQDWIVD